MPATIRTIGETRAGEIAVHGFLDCRDVTVDEIITSVSNRTAAACAGRRIVAVQDTTAINFRGRDRGRRVSAKAATASVSAASSTR